jgi:hypothetical protein
VCPVEAITEDLQATTDALAFVEDNRRFFTEVLPGRTEAVGEPGGAADLGRIGADTTLVAGRPVASATS